MLAGGEEPLEPVPIRGTPRDPRNGQNESQKYENPSIQ